MGDAYRRFLARLREVRALGVELGLDRVRLALERLGHPERRVPAIHIAGTNGKGSCAALCDSILRESGIRVGLFTSPHLVRFTERIRIDGVEIDGDHLAMLDQAVAGTSVPLTYFEVATVLACLAFAEAQVDIAVLETGLGGRLDATSACQPVACAITSIAFDHEAILGHSLSAIAYEKACIAKPSVPLFLGPLPGEADATIAEVAAKVGAPILRAGTDYPPAPAAPALLGAHQLANAALAVALSRQAGLALGRPITDGHVLDGLAEVRWPGRLERILPDVLLDCAHNVEGVGSLLAALPEANPRVLVTSIVRDKDAARMLALLSPHFDFVVATRSQSERALPAEDMAAMIQQTRGGARRVSCVDNPHDAVAMARDEARNQPDGLVVVAGSIFLVGAVRERLLRRSPSVADASDPLP